MWFLKCISRWEIIPFSQCQEVNLQDRFGGIALVTYEARGWAKVGDNGG